MSAYDEYFPPVDEGDPSPPAAAPPSQGTGQVQQQEFEDDIYKKWFRTKSQSGFLAVRGWLEAGKVSVDIGELGEGGLKGNTNCFTNAVQLAVYLRAVVEGRAAELYPPGNGAPSPESFVYYGGGNTKTGPVSRILKIHHWKKGTGDSATYDASSFVWKCGHFGARTTQSGAFVPDYNKVLSTNLIKVTRQEMAEVSYRLDLALQAFTATHANAFKALNGNNR